MCGYKSPSANHHALMQSLRDLQAVPEFRWRTNDGLALRPCDMRTGHLFNSLVMLWHNAMPKDAWLRANFKRWDLSHVPNLDVAVPVLARELATRDLAPYQRHSLLRMAQYLARGTTVLPPNPRKIEEGTLNA